MIPKVSVIVPVYKTEKYLRRCLDSLVVQTLEELEIIVVNDESPDDSQQIIDEFTLKYPEKIKSLAMKNSGQGYARNYGLEHAKGEYIGFVDSDDWVHPEMFELLYKAALQGNDIVICDIVVVKDSEELIEVAKGFRGLRFDRRQIIMYSTDPAFACNKLFKRSLFDTHKFSKGWYEDIATIPILISYSVSPTLIKLPLYCYRQRPGSVTNSFESKTLEVIDAWERVLKESNQRFINEIVFAVARNIAMFINFKPQYAEEFIMFANKYKDIIKANKYYTHAVSQNQFRDLFKTTFFKVVNTEDLLKNVSILIPFVSDNGHRENVFRWVMKFYENVLPEVEICIGTCESTLFSRSQAINNAAAKATKDIFVIADSDLIYDPTILTNSIDLLKVFSWVVPYFTIDYLTQESTVKLLGITPTWPLEERVDAATINLEKVTGGLCIIPRKNFEIAGGFDNRFEGWGGEDDAFCLAMNTLCGYYKRIHSNILHLWHPNNWSDGNPHYKENLQLYKRYMSCNGNKFSMQKLIKEAKNIKNNSKLTALHLPFWCRINKTK